MLVAPPACSNEPAIGAAWHLVLSTAPRRASEIATTRVLASVNRDRATLRALPTRRDDESAIASRVRTPLHARPPDVPELRDLHVLARVVDLLDDAVLIVDARGALHHRNVRGTALLSREVVSMDAEGRLTFVEPNVATFFARILDGRLVLPATRALAVDPNGLPCASLFVERLDDEHLILWIRTADPLPWRARHWVAETFGLSGAEARLIVALTEGLTPPDVAERFGIALGTVRVQLRSIYGKLGVKRQSEIVARVMRLLPPLRGL